MAVSEFAKSPINHFEYAQQIRESNIAQRLDDAIYNPLQEELAAISATDKLTVKREGVAFKIKPIMCGIRRFDVVDNESNTFHEIVVKEDFVEVKTKELPNLPESKTVRHIWNCPEALITVWDLLNKYNSSSNQ